MGITRFIASQLRQPHGWFGSVLMGRLLDLGNRKIMDCTLALLEVEPQHQVLEIGFGGGYALARVSKMSRCTVTGVDVSVEMVRHAERRFAREISAGRVHVQLGDISHLQFADETFDRVFTINTIYFWSDALQGLNEIRRVLKQGGRAAISTRSKERMEKRALTRHECFVRLLSPEDLARLMRTAGFGDIRVHHRDQHKLVDQVIVLGNR